MEEQKEKRVIAGRGQDVSLKGEVQVILLLWLFVDAALVVESLISSSSDSFLSSLVVIGYLQIPLFIFAALLFCFLNYQTNWNNAHLLINVIIKEGDSLLIYNGPKPIRIPLKDIKSVSYRLYTKSLFSKHVLTSGSIFLNVKKGKKEKIKRITASNVRDCEITYGILKQIIEESTAQTSAS